MLEDEHMAYIPCCVYADNEPPAVEGWLKKNESQKTNSRILQLKCWFVFSSIFIRLNHWNLGTR